MREYDTTFIVQPEISEEGREALLQKLSGVLERAGALPLEVEDIGKRKLAYEIQKFQKGHYLSLFFLDDGKAVTEFERALRLEDSILRFLTIQKQEDVTDIEARKALALEQERIRKERAAERAAREAEERAAREAARLEAEAEEQARTDDARAVGGEGSELDAAEEDSEEELGSDEEDEEDEEEAPDERA